MHGRNLAYEMGTYSYFYHRPAWRILQQADAPDEVKSALREFIIQIGDRLAFCRGIELVNGNSLASSVVCGLKHRTWPSTIRCCTSCSKPIGSASPPAASAIVLAWARREAFRKATATITTTAAT